MWHREFRSLCFELYAPNLAESYNLIYNWQQRGWGTFSLGVGNIGFRLELSPTIILGYI